MNKQTCLKLIQLFESHRVLWDPMDTNFYNKELKEQAWNDISYKMDIPVEDLVKKISNLRGVFRKERFRKRQFTADGESYEPKWFAFQALSFLEGIRSDRSKDTPSEPSTSATINVKIEEKTDAETDSNPDNEKEDSDTRDSDAYRPLAQAVAWVQGEDEAPDDVLTNSPKKRKTNPKCNKRSKKVNSEESLHKPEDGYETFGKLVASELRKYDYHTLAHVKKAIMDVIFHADTGNLPGVEF